MTPDATLWPELATSWETVVQPLLWYAVPNGLLNFMTALWLFGALRNQRRLGEAVAVRRWTLYSVLIGLILPAVTGPMAWHVWRDARRRNHAGKIWVGIVSVLSFIGFIGYAVYDDADCRRMRARRWAAGAMLWHLLLFVGLPVIVATSAALRAHLFRPAHLLWLIPSTVALLIVFPILYAACRRPLRFADVKKRMTDTSAPASRSDNVLKVERLRTWFPVRSGVFATVRDYVKAVDEVDLTLARGETLGLVGESGCGKTTLGRTVLGLIPITSGRVWVDGVDLSRLNGAECRALCSTMQVIFQDPIGSLNPRMTVRGIIAEGLDIHKIGTRRERRESVEKLAERVGLSADALDRYPHEFSGGQRQRIGIARALALGADLIVCDEPVSALDVSIQAQIVNLMRDLQKEFGMSYLFIAHDLAVVEHISDRVAVMYCGKIVEEAPRDALYARPLHPYTRALMASIPKADPAAKSEAPPLKGDLPSPIHPPSGCRFRTRCPEAIPACAEHEPESRLYEPGHRAACIRIEEHLAAYKPPTGTA